MPDAVRSTLLHRIRRRMGPRLLRLYEPEDVLQDALVVALLSGGTSSSPFATLRLLALAEHRILALASLERPRIRPRRATPFPAALVALDWREEADEGRVDRDGCDARELAAEGLGALERLSFEKRVCLVLRDLVGLSWSSVGTTIGRSADAARRLHGRARSALRADPGAGRDIER